MLNVKTDSELVYLISTGNLWAFELLITRYKNHGFNLALKITSNRELSEEILQDSFLKVYDNIKNFRKESKFSTWFYKIVYNTSLYYLKKEKRDVKYCDEYMGEKSSIYHEFQPCSYDSKYLREKIEVALKKLPKDYGILLTLFYLNDQSIEEISTILGDNKNNIKVRLMRARRKLRDLLAHVVPGQISDTI